MKRYFVPLLLILFQTAIYAKCDIEPIQDVPHIAINERYSSVRQKLLSAGWLPYRAPNALPCELDDKRCANRPEMLACSGVGMGPCAWLWKKNRMILVVDTLADVGDELFVGIGQYYGCGYTAPIESDSQIHEVEDNRWLRRIYE